MVMLNDMDRFHLVMDVIDRVPGLGLARRARCASRWSTSGCATARTRARYGDDMPDVRDWTWPGAAGLRPRASS